MRCDNSTRVERLDSVECRDPFPSLLRIRLGEVEVDIVVGGIAGNHESDGGNIQTGRIVRVRMTAFHNLARTSGEAFCLIVSTTLGVATALAFGNRSRRVPIPNQWSPWPCVM